MATKKISELEAITEADGSDVLAIVDVSEGKTNKITKNNLLIGAGHSIEMSLNQETYALTLTLKNAAGTELSTASIDLPNENAVTNISYNNGKLTLTKQSGATTEVDISGLINGLVTESDFSTFTTQLNQVLQELDETKADAEDVEALQTRVTELEQENEDLKNNQLTNTPTPAISHYLQDSADSRFRKFIPIGRTTQESTKGDNLISSENIDTTISGVTYKSQIDGTILANGTKYGGGFANFSNNTVQLEPGEYSATCFLISGTISKSVTVYLYNPNNSINISELGRTGKSFEIAEVGTYYLRFGVWTDGTVFNNAKIGFMLVKGSSIPDEFERFTGGQPAPNPKYPFAIKNTGDNGSINEKVQNKNLIGLGTQLNGYVDGTSMKMISTSGTPSSLNSIGYYFKTSILPNEITFSCDGGNRANVCYFDEIPANNVTCLSRSPSNTLPRTLSVNKNYSYVHIQFSYNDTNLTNIQIEPGSTATSYVPHEEQNISFPLAQGQKLYEGSCPDDDEKVHHVRTQIILDGSNDEEFDKHPDTNEIRFYTTGLGLLNGSKILCNMFTQGTKNTNPNNVRWVSTTTTLAFYSEMLDTDNMTIAQWRQYLSEHNLILEIDLAEEQTEDFTEEQKTAWEQIKSLRTYKNITHISSEDETPANVEIEYVRDLETVINNLTTRVETIESEV